MTEKIVILDFGSQYTQLIGRRIRELGVYSEIIPFNKLDKVDDDIRGVILSGSPFSSIDDNALEVDYNVFLGKIPILAICYGAQYMASRLGGKVEKSDKREYGKAKLIQTGHISRLLKGVSQDSQVWMSHADTILTIPAHAMILAKTEDIPVAAFQIDTDDKEASLYCIQFHPEVTHSLEGMKMLSNFVNDICHCEGTWSPESFIEETVKDLRMKIGSEKVLLGLSGGVDSSVASVLLSRAIGENLHCLFVDNGLLRKNEFEEVLHNYKELGLNVKGINARKEFLDELEGEADPETKRKIIGRVFIEIFEREAKKIEGITYLAQGTIYPDVIESVSVHGPSVTIKSHHNVGGLPAKLALKIVEPLRMLFKDEVRKVGETLQMPDYLIHRHPFPGPGLSIRILGEISREKIAILQEADRIYIDNLHKYDLYDKVWQAGAILLPVKSVGVMGDERSYEYALVLRCVNSMDGMTAEWSKLPNDFLAKTSNQIINQVKGINRVVYDISTKPPATIEWE